MLEQFNASKTDGFSSDIKAEMEKIVWADLANFHNFPSGMKQYLHY